MKNQKISHIFKRNAPIIPITDMKKNGTKKEKQASFSKNKLKLKNAVGQLDKFTLDKQNVNLLNQLSARLQNQEISEKEKTHNIVKLISQKKAKYDQFVLLKKKKRNCFDKLAVKLKQDLKQLQNHDCSIAKQKIKLLDVCMNHKHQRKNQQFFRTRQSSRIYNKEDKFADSSSQQAKATLIQQQISSIFSYKNQASSSWKRKRTIRRMKSAINLGSVSMQKNKCEHEGSGLLLEGSSNKNNNNNNCCNNNNCNYNSNQLFYDMSPRKQCAQKSRLNTAINKIQMKCQDQVKKTQHLRKDFGVFQFYQSMIFRNTAYIMKKLL